MWLRIVVARGAFFGAGAIATERGAEEAIGRIGTYRNPRDGNNLKMGSKRFGIAAVSLKLRD